MVSATALAKTEAPDDDERERRYRVIRVGDAAHSGIGNTVIASIVVKAREIVVEKDGNREYYQVACSTPRPSSASFQSWKLFPTVFPRPCLPWIAFP
jgi:hypothetical protein